MGDGVRAARSGGAERGSPAAISRAESAATALPSCLLLVALLGLAGLQLLAYRPYDPALLAWVIGTGLAAACSWTLVERSPNLSSLLLLAGLMVAAGAAIHLAGAMAVQTLILPVLLAGALLGPGAALPAALVAGAVAWAALPPEVASLPHVATLGAAGLSVWLVLRPLWASLNAALTTGLESARIAAGARDQRGKLNQTIKALDDAYQWLQQTNRQLVLARQEADMLRDMRSRFATNLSHELRTPLNIILGFGDLICTRPQLYGYSRWSDSLLRDLAEIRRNAGYLSGLVDDIIDLARVDALAMPVRRQSVSLGEVIADAVATVRGLAHDKGLRLTVRVDPALPPVLIDPVRVRQVVFNLISNAIRYTEAGEVSVETGISGDDALVTVRDTGRGIPEDEIATIFNEFYQVGWPSHSTEMGKGLGLAIAKRFVQLHGGRIWAESRVGVGSTFRFTLPLSGAPAWATGRLGRMPLPRSRLRPTVLVVDEGEAAAAYLARRIEGYDFQTVGRGDAAALLASHRPHAVIANSRLSGIDDRDEPLLTALVQDTPVLTCALPDGTWLGGQHRFDAVLTKPVTLDALRRALAPYLTAPDTTRVMVVDDDRGFVQLIGRMLQADDGSVDVLAAYSGEEALRRLQTVRPHVLLLDLRLPRMDGLQVLAQVRADPVLSGLPVVAVTAATPGEEQPEGAPAAFSYWRRSAFRPGELIRLIEVALDPSRMEPIEGSAAALPETGPARPAS